MYFRIGLAAIRMINATILSLVWWTVATVLWNKFIGPLVLTTARTLKYRLGTLVPLLKS
ncbi:MAG: hypothetical protein ACJ8BW_04950 [Ktedonobacteraceae bacterium]|jgi:hypothetical protein